MAISSSRKSAEPRQPIFGHGSLINPSAEHTILNPFGPPGPTIAKIYENMTQTNLVARAAEAVAQMDPVIIQPDDYTPGPDQPLPSID
jgi:hypothetical protein